MQKCLQGFVNTSLEKAVPSHRTGSDEQQFAGKEEAIKFIGLSKP